MDWFASIVSSLNNVLWSYVLIGLLICVGLWFTFCTRFVQITNVREMFRCVLEGSRTPRPEGHISPFQAFCISTASRVGVGNIAGIAIAVVTGGPGAIFWMWVIATLGAASGFIESTLAQIYKVKKPGGGFMGGPAYYIKNALGSPFWAGVFAVLISVTYALIFNSVQANTISLSIETTTGLKPAYTGLILAVLTGLVIFGGMTRIAKVASFMVPFMAGAYLLLAFVVTCMNITEVPRVLLMIVTKAFNMAKAMKIPVLGIVENYSYLACPDCGKHISVFGESHIDEVAAHYELPVLAKLPIDPKLAAAVDAGKIEDAKLPDELSGALKTVEGLL